MADITVNESIISAKTFYNITLGSQEIKVAEFIRTEMEGTKPKLYLPFGTYPALDELLEKRGWVYDWDNAGDDAAIYCPAKGATQQVFDKTGIIPSAREYYEATLANQWKRLQERLMSALENGETNIKLPFAAYDDIKDKMKARGWEFEEWTDEVTEEEYTLFYPKCGYDD